jgi:hypothetical protein
MTEETTVIDAVWWRRVRRRARSHLDPAIARRGAAAAIPPARCAGDLAAASERLLGAWHAACTAAVAADLRLLSVTLLAFSDDQLAAKDRAQGGGTASAGAATSAARYSLAAREIADLPPDRDPAGRLTALASGLGELHGWLAVRECIGGEVSRR